jgi:hypothetical protein
MASHHVGIGTVVIDVENNHLVLRASDPFLSLATNLFSVAIKEEDAANA